jgi:hypothetical protein
MYISLRKSLALSLFISLLNIIQLAIKVFLNINIFNKSFHFANYSFNAKEVKIVSLLVIKLTIQVAVILVKRLGYTI